MSITETAIRNDRVTYVALIAILIAGIGAYRGLPQNEDPGFVIRVALVMTYFPGASPERVEQLVTDRLEEAIQEMPEIEYISSESKTGVSLIYVHIQESYKVLRPIWDDLRRKVDRVAQDLPDGVRGPFVNDEFGDVFGIIVALTGEGYTYAELKDVADEVRDELLLIDEAAKVEILGAQEERVFVEYNNARLAEFGLSPTQLAHILDARNIIIPGGYVTTDRERIVLEPTGNFESVEDLRRTVIQLPGRQDLLYLEDLANIHRGYIDPPRSKMRYNGAPCLGLAVNLRQGGNVITLGKKVRETIDRLQGVYPIGMEFGTVAFQPMHVARKVQSFVRNLLQAVLIVLAVMLVSLGMRTGFIVAPLIPMAMIMSLLIMSLLDIGIDQMSLAALIIALGMLVDNAIVMSESIMVLMAEGKKPVEAAIASGKELRVPLLTSSLTTAAAFLPIYLAESSTGEYTAPLFKVVTIALLSSWVLSLTMTPLLCARFLRVEAAPDQGLYGSRFYRGYRRVLLWLLRHRALTVIVTVGVFAGTMTGFRFIPNIFFPANDKAILTAELELPVGTPIERTEAMVEEVEAFLAEQLVVGEGREEGIVNWATFIGQGAPRFVLNFNPEQAKPEYAVMIVNATSVDVVQQTIIPRLEAFCAEGHPDLTYRIQLLPTGPPPQAPVEVRLSGRDTDVLFGIVDQVAAKMADTPGTKNIKDDWGPRTKKLRVNVNQPRARRAGLTNLDVAVSLQTFLSGYESTQYREGDEVIPIILRSVEADRQDLGKLESLNIYAQTTGQSVPLKQVADVEVVWQPARIFRRDRIRTVTVECDIDESVTAIGISSLLGEWLDEQAGDWGVGYKYELGGEMEESIKANESITAKLPVAGLIILFLLVAQFNSVRRPLIILLTIPLGMIGVVVGLLVARSYFGFMTLLGIISLSGIVINNAIVLLDRIRIEIEENGLPPQQAVVESAQRRLRPILLTTFTTVGGLLPLWFGGGPMWEPMAVSIIFGLLFATILTLGFVPVLYALFFRVRFRDVEL